MSIVLIGGHDRMHENYRQVCKNYNCNIKIYTQLPARFDKVIGNPDRIVLFTSTVSHKMARTAVSQARRKKIPVIRSHSSSTAALKELLDQLAG